jgi:hypothetical protein
MNPESILVIGKLTVAGILPLMQAPINKAQKRNAKI